jgi:4'-phosphopantetheinyl transferase
MATPETARGAQRWSPAPAVSRADPEAIHVWRVHLDVPGDTLPAFEALLTDEERARAAALRLEARRRRFVVARATLRLLLGRYLDRAPAEILFTYGDAGKPALAHPTPCALTFNLAHAGELALYAVTTATAIGVDVERVRSDVPIDQIAARFFAPAEIAALAALDPEKRRRRFFEHWVAKEAYAKARGLSVWSALGACEVGWPSSAALPPWLRLGAGGDTAGAPALHFIEPARDHVAAVVGLGPAHRIVRWHWQPAPRPLP